MKNFSQILEFIRKLYPGMDFIPLHAPCFKGNEKKYLQDCIDSTFVSSVGKYVDKFEELVCDYTGANHAIATVNGTAALHVALLLAGVQRGDLVITQPLTFVATCNAISYCGAELVFIDIDKRTLGLSADALAEWLSENVDIVVNDNEGSDCATKSTRLSYKSIYKKTKQRISACVPMHTFGHPCEIDRIVAICEQHYIPVVEDSAESIGSYFKGQHTGTFGKQGIFSFNGNKTITTGGGGMIITNDDNLGKLAKHITTTAKKPHPWKFEHDMIGYNYRLPNINAALGCAQMELLPEIITNKRETAREYQKFFCRIPDVEFFNEPSNCNSNYWLNAILFNDQNVREEFLEITNSQKITTRPAWTLMNELTPFRNSICGELTNAENIVACLVNIPSSVRY